MIVTGAGLHAPIHDRFFLLAMHFPMSEIQVHGHGRAAKKGGDGGLRPSATTTPAVTEPRTPLPRLDAQPQTAGFRRSLSSVLPHSWRQAHHASQLVATA